MEPVDGDLKELCELVSTRIALQSVISIKSTFDLVAVVLRLVAKTPSPAQTGGFHQLLIIQSIPKRLPTTRKLWLIRVMLQPLWR